MAFDKNDMWFTVGIDTSGLNQGLNNIVKDVQDSVKKMQTNFRALGVAMMAVGGAGLAMVESARALNTQLSMTAQTVGVSANKMKQMALAVTDVSFPLKDVTATFELLARAGMKNTSQMEETAKAFDSLGSAIGEEASQVADTLIPAFNVFGIDLADAGGVVDKFTWLTKNTTVNLDDFGAAMTWVAREGSTLGLTLDDMVAIMAVLNSRGITGAAATRAFRSAVTEAVKENRSLNEVLGISQTEIDGYKTKLDSASGITKKYADLSEKQYGIMAKLKQAWGELSLRLSAFLTPLEPVLAGMTAAGSIMMFLSTSVGLSTASWIAHAAALAANIVKMVIMHPLLAAQILWTNIATAAQWAWNAALAANPIGLVIVAIGAMTAALALFLKTLGQRPKTQLEEYAILLEKEKKELDALTAAGKGAGEEADKLRQKIELLNGILERHSKATEESAVSESNLTASLKERENTLVKVAEKQELLSRLLREMPEATGWIENVKVELANLYTEYDKQDSAVKRYLDTNKDLDALYKKLPPDLQAYVDNLRQLKPTTDDTSNALSEFLDNLKSVAKEWAYSLTVAGRLGLTMKDLELYLLNQGWTIEQITVAYNKWGSDVNEVAKGIGVDLQDVARAASQSKEQMLSDAKTLASDAKDKARERTRVEKEAIDSQMQKYRDAHQEKMAGIQDEYNAQIMAIDAASNAEIMALQERIDAIDKTIDDARKLEEDKQNQERIDELKGQIANETDADKRSELQKELDDFLLQLQRQKQEDELRDQQEALRRQIQTLRNNAELQKQIALEQYEAKKKIAEQELKDFIATKEQEKTDLDLALDEQLKRYDDELAAFEKMLEGELDAMEKYVAAYNALVASMRAPGTGGTGGGGTGTGGTGGTGGGATGGGGRTGPGTPGGEGGYIPGLAPGGIVMRPLIARLGEMAPNIPEAVIPLDRLRGMIGSIERGTANIFIYLDGQVIARAIGQPLVDNIRIRTGVHF
jgi:methyl-accepting chemotaxis protein